MSKKLLWVIALLAISVNSVWASELSSAQALAAKWVIKAQSNTSDFRLGDTITRKEMMKIVMNLSGKNVPDTCAGSFGDVVNDWGCKYIETALANGFIAKNANFRPNDTITKAESMKLLMQARGIDRVSNTSDWQGDWMNTAFNNGLLSAKYTDHNTAAKRGFLFDVGAKPISSSVATSTPAPTPVATATVRAGSFVNYNSSLLWATDNTILFFHASWCPSCLAAEKNINKEDIGSTDITLLKVDYDSNTDLRKKYGVTTQHTFVQVDAQWNLIKKWNGGNSLADIQAKIK